jgi:hypothetical protein
MAGKHVAFMCYARFDDDDDAGRLSEFRRLLSAEVQAQSGQEFVIFQDREHISWGQSWQEVIDETLDAVTQLLVVVSPGLFRSQACRAEVSRFRERERELGRSDLILPLYYISAREIDDPAARQADEMAGVLASRQFADWRDLRLEPIGSQLVRKAIAQLAARMTTAFWQQAQAGPRPSGEGGRETSAAPAVDAYSWLARDAGQSRPPFLIAGDDETFDPGVLEGGISADLVNPAHGIPREEDDLGVSTYVAMMAATITRKATKLPLSIGLFGEWGSGKSYFMGLLRKQVQELASSGDPAYCSEIVQIGFNAWSYADTNLWASLGDAIFRELAGPTDDEGEAAEGRKRRERLRTWLADEQGRLREVEAAKDTATAEVARLRAELERREHDRRNSAVALLRATVEAVQADKKAAAELRSAWGKLGVKDESEQARLLADAVTGARDDVSALRRAAAGGNGRYAIGAAVFAGLVAVIIGLSSSGVLGHFVSRVVTGAGLATLLAAAAAGATLTRRVADGARMVVELATQVRQRVQVGKNEQVRAAVEQVRAAEAREQVLGAQLDQVVARVGELGRELVELSPGQRLYAFVAERAASDDYRRHTGLIATIRRDFERLARLQDQWRKDKDGGSPRPIDRIVLYIDDLDRCTPQQVVEVLQAVHLLLALDLFVVVVGVDPRWLLYSLRDQYRTTLTTPPSASGAPGVVGSVAAETSRGRDDRTWQEDAGRLVFSTPHDYLEKIFNVPFVLPAMTSRGFGMMIRRLSAAGVGLGGREATSAQTETLDNNETVTIDTDAPPRVEEGSEVAALRNGGAPSPTPLTEPELQALASLAPLVRSPRDAKRLLNLYRMLRSTRDLSDASRFLGTDGAEGEFQAVVMLLGLLSENPRLLGEIIFTYPDLEEELIGGICHRTNPCSWNAFLSGLRPRYVDENWCNDLRNGLSDRDRSEWETLVERAISASAFVKLPDLTGFKAWAPHVARFSYLLTPTTNDHGGRPA